MPHEPRTEHSARHAAPAAHTAVENAEAAHAARLHYVSDELPGITRWRRGRGFSYHDPDGKLITGAARRERFEALAIPPAWTDVWICPDPDGHLQATGRDAAGRKQYIYHPRWREVRDQTKFDRLVEFAHHLPRIRRSYDADMRRHTMCRERVLGIAVALLDRSHIRIGNEAYARTSGSRGLTTLTRDHVDVTTTTVDLEFVGKHGRHQHVTIHDRRLARQIQSCLDIPGFELFNFVNDDGQIDCIDSGDVNDYLRETTGQDYTARYFRTWGGTVAAAEALRALDPPRTDRDLQHAIATAIDAAAARLGNTRAVARKYYIHPAIFDAARSGHLWQLATDDTPLEDFVLALLEG